MKNIEIKINKETRMVDISKYVLGNDGENLQGNLVFSFKDEFVNGQARLEYEIDGNKNYVLLDKIDETYQIPILSVITKKGQIDMQLVIAEGTNEFEVPIFKSNIFYLTCNASINAEIPQPDEYAQWIEVANTKLNEIDNLDIDAKKENGVATITVTKKDGSQEVVEIYDGEAGGGTGGSEKDPTVPEFIKNITEEDLDYWNNKSNFSGNYNDLIDAPTIPTKISEFNNDIGYVTKTVNDLENYYQKNEVNDLLGSIKNVSILVVDDLPSEGETNIIYLVSKIDGEAPNIYDEYIWANESFEKIGSTDIDLTNYATKEYVDNVIADAITGALESDY